MEVVRLSGAPPSRRVRPQSHNPRSKGGQSQGSPKNPAKTALVVQIPNNTGYINSMGSPKQGRIFNTEPDYRALPPSRGTRSGSPCCGRAGSPSRFGGRCGTSESNVMRQSPNMMARPTSPAEQRQTINELINKTNFYLEVLENPNPQERHVNKSKANRLLHHIDSCQHELQEAGRVLHPAARVPKARPKSALSVSLSVGLIYLLCLVPSLSCVLSIFCVLSLHCRVCYLYVL